MVSLKHFIFKHLPLFFLAVYSTLMIFPNLDNSALQVDEGGDTFISTTLLKSHFPRHSDGINSSMLFANVHDGLFVYRPWVPYYIQSFSLSLFGQTTFAARLPFALIGVFAVIFLYLLLPLKIFKSEAIINADLPILFLRFILIYLLFSK